jgi:ubiquinone/menaquinone biosynthesis C-methylase UbiE
MDEPAKPRDAPGPRGTDFWEEFYSRFTPADFYDTENLRAFQFQLEQRVLRPFYKGGSNARGFAFDKALQMLFREMKEKRRKDRPLAILDVGSGFGDYTVYMASKNPDANVIGLDAAVNAKKFGESLSAKLKVSNCSFLAESISRTSLADRCIDGIIGFGALHHFVTERKARDEIGRVLRPDGCAIFVDSFHENPLFTLFHDKKAMEQMGDHMMSRKAIELFWGEHFELEIIPVEWMAMIDKLIDYIRQRLRLKAGFSRLHLQLSRLLFLIDRRIEKLPRRLTLPFAGSIITVVRPKADSASR